MSNCYVKTNPDMIRILTGDELERHLWQTEPYSPRHLALIDLLDEGSDEIFGLQRDIKDMEEILLEKESRIVELREARNKLAEKLAAAESKIRAVQAAITTKE